MKMKQVYDGKTKTVFKTEDGNICLLFKDDMTGEDGVFDPGANTAGVKIKDNGYYGLAMSAYFFKLFESSGIKTHFISANLETRTMDVKKITTFGSGIELICRYVATGSFIRRYGGYIADGAPLPAYIEISLKDDERGDPFISQELLEVFDILEAGEYQTLVALTKQISDIILLEIEKKGMTLFDLKLEFGKDETGEIILIDEVSGGNMRVKKDGESVDPITLAKEFL